jgi:hypothetical protein
MDCRPWPSRTAYFACVLIGILTPIPLIVLYVFLSEHVVIRVSEARAPLIFLGAFWGIGLCSSLFAGLLCRRIVQGGHCNLKVFLANSSGWLGLALFLYLLLPPVPRHTLMDVAGAFLYAAIPSTVGLLITWVVMTPRGRKEKEPKVGCPPTVPPNPTMSSDIFISIFAIAFAVVAAVLWLLWRAR